MITLLSDFGLQDASVAIAKGILMQHVPSLQIIDISHEVQPFHEPQAAYLLASAYKNFPAGSYHLLLFDIFSEPTIRLILSEHQGHYFLCADNGILPQSLAAQPATSWLCMELSATDTFNDWLHAAGNIIHLLASKQPSDLGLQPYTLTTAPPNKGVVYDDGAIICDVIHVDRFDNVVINFTQQQYTDIGNDRRFKLRFVGVEQIDEIVNNYSDVRPGYKLCRFNSNGYMEICINRGKAASIFGMRMGGKFNDIKIYFE